MLRHVEYKGPRDSGERGLAFVELAFILPMLAVVALIAVVFFSHIRSQEIAKHAAELAAKIVSNPNQNMSVDGKSNVSWDITNLPYRPQFHVNQDQCRGRKTEGETMDCLLHALNQTPDPDDQAEMDAMVWAGYNNEFPQLKKTSQLPFALFERPTNTPGFYPVQAFPMIGIERGCVEPLNETGAFINLQSRGYDFSDPNNCSHVKPIYWQSPERGDVDGDAIEDPTFFKPRNGSTQTNTTWGSYGVDRSEMDYIVYLSGMGYTFQQGQIWLNITAETNAIPFLADFDRDYKADLGVFEPRTGTYRVAFSGSGFRRFGEGDAGISDSSGTLGLIAIPGTFSQTNKMQLAIFQTGGAAKDRYVLHITQPFVPDLKDIQNGNNKTIIKLGGSSIINQADLRPFPGMAAVPAFGQYDNAGRTQVGWLNFSGGSLSKWVAGAVPAINDANHALNGNTTSNGNTPTAISAVLNPYALETDSSGGLFYTDSVNGALYYIDPPADGTRGDISNSAVHEIIPPHTGYPTGQTRAAGDNYLPRENVGNVPYDKTNIKLDNEAAALTASTRYLTNPKKIVLAPDGALYIADFGAGRIIRVDNPTDPKSKTWVVLGSEDCTTGSNDYTKTSTNSGIKDPSHNCDTMPLSRGDSKPWLNPSPPLPLPPTKGSGKFEMYPQGIAVVPDATLSGYFDIAFSSGFGVFLITPVTNSSNMSAKGPTGASGEIVYNIAGSGSLTGTVQQKWNSTGKTNGAGTPFTYYDGFPLPPNPFSVPVNFKFSDPASSGLGNICPIADLKYDSAHARLIGAASCSLTVRPKDLFTTDNFSDRTVDYPGYYTNSGGLYSIPVNLTTFPAPVVLAGSFLQKPCFDWHVTGKCSGPSDTISFGAYQRRIDLGASPTSIDIENPVSIAFGPQNSLYVVNQWNDGPASNPYFIGQGSIKTTGYYPYAPTRTDQQHHQEIFGIKLNSDGTAASLFPVTNPFAYGTGSIPVENAYWRSPYDTSMNSGSPPTTEALDIPPHEAPLMNAPFPATSSIAIFHSSSGAYLYAASPALNNPITSTNFPAEHPYHISTNDIGFIYRADLDSDGDAINDFDDPSPNGVDTANNGLPPPFEATLGNPVQYFSNVDSTTLIMPGGGGTSNKAQFFMVNSVSSCGTETDCVKSGGTYNGAVTRPEIWATLLNYGDDQDLASTSQVCKKNSELSSNQPNTPYYRCASTSNGPIAAPVPLHSLVGYNVPSALGGDFYRNSVVRRSQSSFADPHLWLYPMILSSTMPRENGIKQTRRVPTWTDTKPSPGIGLDTNGDLCGEYAPQVYGVRREFSTDGNPGFYFDISNPSNYLNSYMYSGIITKTDGNGEDYDPDNDNLNYARTCTAPTTNTPTEGIVLQLDHDDDSVKDTTHWPNEWTTGPQFGILSIGQNARQFLMLDGDGDGTRNPCYLTTDSFDDNGGRNFKTMGPYTLICTGMKRKSGNYYSITDLLDVQRDPFNVMARIETNCNRHDGLGFTSLGSSYLKPVYFGYSQRKSNISPISCAGKSLKNEINFGFDPGFFTNAYDQLYPVLYTNLYDQTVFLGLDFEPYRAQNLVVHMKQDVGAGRYANYIAPAIFKNSPENPNPALRAGLNSIMTALNVQDESKIVPGMKFCKELENHTYDCFTDCGKDYSCTHVLAEFDGTGNTLMFGIALAPIDRAALKRFLSYCDPDPNAPYPCPADLIQ